MASQCYMAGRIEAAVRYSDAAQTVLGNDRDEMPYGIEGWVGGAYVYIGQPERCVEWYRAQLARGRDTHTLTRAALVIALKIAGSEDEAMAATKGLIDTAEATAQPLCALVCADGLRLRFPRRRSRPCAGGHASGRGDRSREPLCCRCAVLDSGESR